MNQLMHIKLEFVPNRQPTARDLDRQKNRKKTMDENGKKKEEFFGGKKKTMKDSLLF